MKNSEYQGLYSSVGYIESFYKTMDINTFGTGFLLFPDIVLTAAHNVLFSKLGHVIENKLKEVADTTSFQLGYNARRSNLPPQCCTFRIPEEWKLTFDPHYDFAVLFLPNSLCGIPVVDMHQIQNSMPLPIESEIVGYPSEITLLESGSQKTKNDPLNLYTSSGEIQKLCQMRKIMSYDSYTLGGNSGGPVAIQKPFPACVGIHTRGSYGLNQGIHYADHMIKYIEKWAIEKDYLESKSIIHTERVMKIIDKVATTKEDKIFLMNNKDKFDSFSEENLEICITMYLKVSKDKKRPLSKSPKFRKSGKMKKEEDRKAKGSVFLLLE